MIHLVEGIAKHAAPAGVLEGAPCVLLLGGVAGGVHVGEGQVQEEGLERAQEAGLRLLLVPERPEERHQGSGDYDAQGQNQGKYLHLDLLHQLIAGPVLYRVQHHQL